MESEPLRVSDRLIVALDVPTLGDMKHIVDSLGPAVSHYKIGHQLFTAEGPKTISYLKTLGKRIFLDLKLHEIPNSVASAIASAGNHGVDMITVHASGGRTMMKVAAETALKYPGMQIIALTVVTGLTDADLASIGVSGGCEAQVARLAKLAQDSGCHGVVSSPREIRLLREMLGTSIQIVTPGIRPTGASQNDQLRADTPGAAIAAGASFIVVGRPIVGSHDPVLSTQNIISEMEAVDA